MCKSAFCEDTATETQCARRTSQNFRLSPYLTKYSIQTCIRYYTVQLVPQPKFAIQKVAWKFPRFRGWARRSSERFRSHLAALAPDSRLAALTTRGAVVVVATIVALFGQNQKDAQWEIRNAEFLQFSTRRFRCT